LKPWLKKMWCIPPQQDAAFVCQMEQVLEVYQRPYDPQNPVVNMDEQHKQLIQETEQSIPASPGCAERVDHEDVRQGACVIWMFVDALGGWRNVTVTENRTAIDWAKQVQQFVDHPRYAAAKRITLVCDNLNTHGLASLYQAFPPDEALRIARRIEIVHTPKHGSWLNIAESELSVLTRQCLGRRMPEQQLVADEARIWTENRNARQVGVDWQFRTDDARIKLKRLYPNVKT
jgi:hypothetical protein